MINSTDLAGKLAIDVQGIDRLRTTAKQSPQEGLRAAAKQFEALFMNTLLKTMREASPSDGLFDSEQTRMYTAMLDQQMAQSVASRGLGLADMLVKQLSRDVAAPEGQVSSGIDAKLLDAISGSRVMQPVGPQSALPGHVQAFIGRVGAHAEEASRITGIPSQFIVGQAALESGWGRHELRAADGSQSFNLFGIKAGNGWKGGVVEATTTEYVNGVAQQRTEKFRAYRSYGEAFQDYAKLLLDSPRYSQVLQQGSTVAGFAQGLQRAGYATDPDYAAKLTNLIKRTLTS